MNDVILETVALVTSETLACMAHRYKNALKMVVSVVDAAYWRPYLAVGAPYGTEPGALDRWWAEQPEERCARCNREMDALEQWIVDDFRRQLIGEPRIPPPN
jgi:hypothetical protein